MNPKYRFFTYINDDTENKRVVYPFYKDDLAKEYELENNQKFYRTKLSGKMSFRGADYDYIMAQQFDAQVNVLIERSDDWGITWIYEFLGKFFRTDCKINEDDKSIEVQPDPVDEYTEVLAGLDKEYDLITIAPEIDTLMLHKRPLIQIYIPGDTIVSCFLGGNAWEQDANATTSLSDLVTDFHFALCNLLKEVTVTITGTYAAASGLYMGRMSQGSSGSNEFMSGNMYQNLTDDYYLTITQGKKSADWAIFSYCLVELKRSSDDFIIYRYLLNSDNGATFDSIDVILVPQTGVTGTGNASISTYRIYARYLLDVESIRGLATYELPSDDIVDYNRNYRRAIGYAIDVGYISQRFSDTPTEWGKADNNKYYLPPYSIVGQDFYPIARSTWRYGSIWFSFDIFDNFVEIDGRKRYLLRDSYPVHSVLNVLLKQFAPNITHTETPDCSLFFYAAQNPITYQKFKLFVTQKTNILNGSYTQPAQKAPATLGQFLNMLRDTYRCFWCIENGKFRIEHVSWFENGGSYLNTEVVGIDLTQLINIRNGKSWDYMSAAYEFDKVDMPERYQFNWMDDVTLAFNGVPIQVLSKYVTPGKIEEISISNFNSDIDMMLLNPADMSKDGFALFAGVNANALIDPDTTFGGKEANNGYTEKYALKSEILGMNAIAKFRGGSAAGTNVWLYFFDGDGNAIINYNAGAISPGGSPSFTINVTIPANASSAALRADGQAIFQFYQLEVPALQELPFVERTVNGVTYYLQNGYLAFVTLQPNYYVYDLPARNVLINGEPGIVFGIQKKKKQNVTFPINGTPNLMELIKTKIGNGMIEKMSVNLHSRMTKTTLKYDTE